MPASGVTPVSRIVDAGDERHTQRARHGWRAATHGPQRIGGDRARPRLLPAWLLLNVVIGTIGLAVVLPGALRDCSKGAVCTQQGLETVFWLVGLGFAFAVVNVVALIVWAARSNAHDGLPAHQDRSRR